MNWTVFQLNGFVLSRRIIRVPLYIYVYVCILFHTMCLYFLPIQKYPHVPENNNFKDCVMYFVFYIEMSSP